MRNTPSALGLDEREWEKQNNVTRSNGSSARSPERLRGLPTTNIIQRVSSSAMEWMACAMKRIQRWVHC